MPSANEQLIQMGYLSDYTGLMGEQYGLFEKFSLGQTTVDALVSAGLDLVPPASFTFNCTYYRKPSNPGKLKPDDVYCRRTPDGKLVPIFVCEMKPSITLSQDRMTKKTQISALEQAICEGEALGVKYAAVNDGNHCVWIDVSESLIKGSISLLFEGAFRDVTPANIEGVVYAVDEEVKDPSVLAEKVWQKLWTATKSEPKDCLLTFVEIFMLKFLSDNLDHDRLPENYSFYYLVNSGNGTEKDSRDFKRQTGKLQIEYYISLIRPYIKTLFPDNTINNDDRVPAVFGMPNMSIVSKTSIINGFVFIRSNGRPLNDLNTTFCEILHDFLEFGKLTSIDPEFKLRLYETFLKKTMGKQQLGQFFTPRNIVREMVRMARLAELPKNSVVLDPACGVGGFILEPLLWDESLAGNITFANGTASRNIVTIGIDNDKDLHILAKANMMLHLAEQVRDPQTSIEALNSGMAETFLLMDENSALGSLYMPPNGTVDVVLANPPYVTKGSSIYRRAAQEAGYSPNNIQLSNYYASSGLGIEGMFLRYISGALKPGGKAFVIVPRGMLNRTETSLKEKLLEECNLLASIELPRNAFFTTAQLTQILVLQKRFSAADDRPQVFCAIARSIGESLDSYRVSIPQNDLHEIASAFIEYLKSFKTDDEYSTTLDTVKTVAADEFDKSSRWDVRRFWSEDEQVKLGLRQQRSSKRSYLASATADIEDLINDMRTIADSFEGYKAIQVRSCKLSDQSLFSISSGDRILNTEIQDHPPINEEDSVVVYSCFKSADIVKGYVSKRWLDSCKRGSKPRFTLLQQDSVTINANGASVGLCYVRQKGCLLTDDVIIVSVKDESIDLQYLRDALQESVYSGNFIYEAKVFQGRAITLTVDIPVLEDGSFDIELQRSIAAENRRFEAVRSRIVELGMDALTRKFSKDEISEEDPEESAEEL